MHVVTMLSDKYKGMVGTARQGLGRDEAGMKQMDDNIGQGHEEARGDGELDNTIIVLHHPQRREVMAYPTAG